MSPFRMNIRLNEYSRWTREHTTDGSTNLAKKICTIAEAEGKSELAGDKGKDRLKPPDMGDIKLDHGRLTNAVGSPHLSTRIEYAKWLIMAV